MPASFSSSTGRSGAATRSSSRGSRGPSSISRAARPCYGDKPSEAAKKILAAIKSVEGVVAEPAPQVIPWALGQSDVQLRAKWWTASIQKEVAIVKSRVVLAIYETCVENGIDLPFPTQIVLLHDQTEEGDGDRTRQREGWPAGKRPPRSAREAEREDGGDRPDEGVPTPSPRDEDPG